MSYALDVFVNCLFLGAVVGFLAGLLGIGGGLIIVPVLIYLLPLINLSVELLIPVALATSLASIVFTSASAALAHHKNNNIPWPYARKIAVFVGVGAIIGAFIVERLSSEFLSNFFAGAIIVLASYMLMSIKFTNTRDMPNTICLGFITLIVGTVASLMGIAGGAILVPVLTYFGIQVRQAIGIATVSGISIAVLGSVGFIYTGLQQNDLPDYSLGYIYLPALSGIVIASLFSVKLGVKMASKLPIAMLKKFFAVFLILAAIKMILN